MRSVLQVQDDGPPFLIDLYAFSNYLISSVSEMSKKSSELKAMIEQILGHISGFLHILFERSFWKDRS